MLVKYLSLLTKLLIEVNAKYFILAWRSILHSMQCIAKPARLILPPLSQDPCHSLSTFILHFSTQKKRTLYTKFTGTPYYKTACNNKKKKKLHNAVQKKGEKKSQETSSRWQWSSKIFFFSTSFSSSTSSFSINVHEKLWC